MKEAKKRNRNILLDILQWGAPHWVGNGSFWSQDNADFIAAFIKGAKTYHDLDINYCGCWNEHQYNPQWPPMLRKTLDRSGLAQVRIVAADKPHSWAVAGDMTNNKELCNAIQVIGVHYPHYHSSPAAQNLIKSAGKSLWSSEDGPWTGRWTLKGRAADGLPQIYSRNYVVGKMTKTVIWSPITCYPDNLIIPGSGMMRANTPWSGFYEVQPAIWITAHTTQFIQPGWKYLGGNACALLPGGGSRVAALSPDGKDLSIVVETMDATAKQSLTFDIKGVSCERLHFWRSNEKEQFVHADDVAVKDGTATFEAEPNCLYSLTTTTGQTKGSATIPPAKPFPLPYKEDFESYAVGATPKYIANMQAAFEVADKGDGTKCLKQIIPEGGIPWHGHEAGAPRAIVGSFNGRKAEGNMRNYQFSLDVCFDFKQYVSLGARVAMTYKSYVLRVEANGAWRLTNGRKDKTLASGKSSVTPGAWHRIGIACKDDRISALIDGKVAGSATDDTSGQGLVSFGCGYEPVKIDNLSIEQQ